MPETKPPPGGWVKCPLTLLRDVASGDLSAGAALTYLVAAAMRDPKPTLSRVTRLRGRNRSTINRHIHELKRNGWLRIYKLHHTTTTAWAMPRQPSREKPSS